MSHITQEQAHAMGAKGAPATEAERLLFEAWMRGHCWALSATWNGTSYVSDTEQAGAVDPRAINTRQLWAAWRDRAALAQPEPVSLTDEQIDSLWIDAKTGANATQKTARKFAKAVLAAAKGGAL